MNKISIIALGALAIGSASLTAGTPAPAPVAPSAPIAAVPSDLSYNLLEVNWLHTEFDTPGLDSSDGVGLSLSYSPINNFYLTAGGAWSSVETARDSADLWMANVGIGGFLPVTTNIHFVTEVGAAFYGFDNSPIGSDNDASLYVRPHFRGRWGRFEAHAGAAWSNIDVTNEWAGFGRLYYGITDNVDLSGGLSAGKDEITFNVGLRLRY